jgi:hypothetical protein
VERGEPLTLYGRDGQVYKGRGDTHVVFSPTAHHNDTHFTTYRSDKGQARANSPTRRAGSRVCYHMFTTHVSYRSYFIRILMCLYGYGWL